jgi:hypothetical protein
MTAAPVVEPGETAPVRRVPRPTPFGETLINSAAALGTVLALVGIILGANMALHRRVVGCENGHYFPEGTTDFRCFSRPHAGDGVSIIVLAAMLGILIVLCSVICHRLVVPTTDGRDE